jgi:hypothetical protein
MIVLIGPLGNKVKHKFTFIFVRGLDLRIGDIRLRPAWPIEREGQLSWRV